MTARELRASVGLAGIFGLRMLGMFVILPVFALYAEKLPGGADLTLVGLAIGIYGLTQALLQIPFGWLSDRVGRKPAIYIGLVLFALGSFIAAGATDIYVIIAGRVVQGAGAISAAVIAFAADLTREEVRTRAMALIGSTIGVTFALSLVAGPMLNDLIGVPGIFAMTGVLALVAVGVVYAVIPDAPEHPDPHDRQSQPGQVWIVLMNRELLTIDLGIFVLHAVLMALFIVVPFELRNAGLPVERHALLYLGVMVASFVVLVPAILHAERRGRIKGVFLTAIAVLFGAQLLIPALAGGVTGMAFVLCVFFCGFNVLEALLPSMVSRIAPVGYRGTALGVYGSVQFLGTFAGASGGGYLMQHFGPGAVAWGAAVAVLGWFIVALGMAPVVPVRTRSFPIPELDAGRADDLRRRIEAVPGVREALIPADGRMAWLKVDAAGFDEQNVVQLIAGDAHGISQ